ncbi:MAG: cupredoxin family protein [Tagaea sp.]|jgi:uncharacterized cupredoxin-like copper-binding protein|nr:cupredoxin family protein [Tagaea sp.]
MKNELLASLLVLALAGASMAVASPGHSGGHGKSALGEPGDPKRVTRTVEVRMNDQMRFLPDRVSVRPGETIRFVVKNIGELPHEMMLGTEQELVEHAKVMQENPGMEHDDEPNAVTVQPGKTGEIVWRFTSAGTFKFGCLKPGHFEAGMVGTLSVRR